MYCFITPIERLTGLSIGLYTARVSNESYILIKSYKILFFQTFPKKSYKLRKNPIFSYILSLLSKKYSQGNTCKYLD